MRPAMVIGLLGGFDVYVDSVNGNDSNDGKSPAAAKQTIAGIGVITAGMRIGLARGSYWREQLTVSNSGVSVGSFGTGDLPVLDGADVAAAGLWSKSGGYANIYQATWVYPTPDSKDRIRVWEDGSPLIRAASLAACDSTPGTFFAAQPPTSTSTVYVHASGSSDPASNGRLYEVSKRKHCLVGATQVQAIHTRRNGHNDGSTVLPDFGIARLCLFEDGTGHNASIAGGGTFDRCVFWRGEDYGGSGTSTLAVFYKNDPTSSDAVVNKCVFVGNNTSSSGKTGVYCHGQSASFKFRSLTVRDSVFFGLDIGSTGDVLTAATERNYVRSCVQYSTAGTSTVSSTDDWIDCDLVSDPLVLFRILAPAITGTRGVVTVNGLRTAVRRSSGALIWPTGSTTGVDLSITRSVAAFRNKTSSPHVLAKLGTGGTLAMSGTAITDASAVVDLASGVSYVGDRNVFFPSTVDAIYNGVTYTDVAAFKVASGQDAASITTDPQLADANAGDFSIGNASAAALPAGLERLSISYTPLPADLSAAEAWLLAQA